MDGFSRPDAPSPAPSKTTKEEKSRIRRHRSHDETMARLVAASDAALAALYPIECCYMVDAQTLLSSRYEYYALWRGERAVGSVALGLREGFAEIKRLFVEESFRGGGHGRELMRFALSRAAALGYEEVRLEVGTRRPEAIGLYRSLGFGEIPPYPPYEPHALSRCFSLRFRASTPKP